MIGVLIIPTGIGAEIGGHSGDGNPVAKLLASCCDKLITHPNVVNAADINEMSENTLYVEGSILDRFLEGKIGLREVLQNKILVAVNRPVGEDTINAVNAARVTIGINVQIVELNIPLKMTATMLNDRASGHVGGWQELLNQLMVKDLFHSFDALALHTPIMVHRNVALDYYRHGGINPWGGVEAKASRLIADTLNKPVAHAPVEMVSSDDKELYCFFENEVADARIAPETISNCYLHSVLKGLNKAPHISNSGISVNDVDFMVSPLGCFGRPHLACIKHNIPIIAVRENKTQLTGEIPSSNCIIVENYWEAVGVIMSMESGIDYNSVRRPLKPIDILRT